MEQEMKKGILQLCILKMLSERDLHGYPMVLTLRTYFPETQESTIYGMLRRLERDGLTSCTVSSDSPGPVKKVYHITKEGLRVFEEGKRSWLAIERAVDELNVVK